jgi:hypothetical protein
VGFTNPLPFELLSSESGITMAMKKLVAEQFKLRVFDPRILSRPISHQHLARRSHLGQRNASVRIGLASGDRATCEVLPAPQSLPKSTRPRRKPHRYARMQRLQSRMRRTPPESGWKRHGSEIVLPFRPHLELLRQCHAPGCGI